WKVTAPDGMITTQTDGPDPRFGMLAPITKSATVKTPANLSMTMTTASSAVLANPADPLSLTSLTYTTATNGRSATSVYQAASHTFTDTSPEGRQATSVLDTLGRLVQQQFTGLAAA